MLYKKEGFSLSDQVPFKNEQQGALVLVEHATLDPGVMSSSPTLVQSSLKKQTKKEQ